MVSYLQGRNCVVEREALHTTAVRKQRRKGTGGGGVEEEDTPSRSPLQCLGTLVFVPPVTLAEGPHHF